MEVKDLRECIRSLARMDETDSVFISCYLNLEKGEALRRGQADMLVLAKEFYEGELKAELIKLAVRHGIKMETISGSHTAKFIAMAFESP